MAILDPNRAVESKFVNYAAVTSAGLTYTGMLAAETGASITLVGQEGKQTTILRSDLEELAASGRSLMPEGMEKDIPSRDFADLIAYLSGLRPPRRVFVGNEPKVVEPEGFRGEFWLLADDCEIYGDTLAYEPIYRNLGMWGSPTDHAVWTFEVTKAAKYVVRIDYACEESVAGNPYQLTVGDTVFAGKVPSTGNWDTYRQLSLRAPVTATWPISSCAASRWRDARLPDGSQERAHHARRTRLIASHRGRQFIARPFYPKTRSLFIAGRRHMMPAFAIALCFAITCVAAAQTTDDDDDDAPPELPAGLLAEITAGGRTIPRVDPELRFDWTDASVDPRLPPGDFVAHWTGKLSVIAPGPHRLHVYAGGGSVRVSLKGQVIVDESIAEPRWLDSEPIELEYGHQAIAVEFRRTAPTAQLGLYWSGPRFRLEPVPPRALLHEPQGPDENAFEQGRLLVHGLRLCGVP